MTEAWLPMDRLRLCPAHPSVTPGQFSGHASVNSRSRPGHPSGPRAARTEVSVEILLLVTARAGEPSAVLPALDLLPHSIRTAPRDVRTLVSGPSPDAVMVDAR